MTLKDKAEIQSLVNDARGAQGFAAADDDAAELIHACCSGVSAETAAAIEDFCAGLPMAAAPFLLIVQVVLQILPLVFGPDGITLEKFQAILAMISQLFVTT